MTKGSIYQGDIALLNTYAANNSVLKYMKQKLTEMKRKLDNSTIIVGDFNTLLSIMGRTTREQINR